MLELCEIINQYGEPLFEPEEKQNDPRKVISFGALFNVSHSYKFTLHRYMHNLLIATHLCNWLPFLTHQLFSISSYKTNEAYLNFVLASVERYFFFQIYTIISDKLVGMLLRARKHKILDFEGECLFQVSCKL